MKRARWLVTATLALALAVIALGAYTRLTDAGLGCPDWPGCYGRLTPPVHDTHIAAAQARFPKGKGTRPVLIHGQFLREDQLDRFKALGVIPSLFPMHTFYWGDWHLDHTVGPPRRA